MASNAAVAKSLARLSRDALLDLCLDWSQSPHSTPYLATNRNLLEAEEEDYLHEPAEDRMRLGQWYEGLKQDHTGASRGTVSKRKIIDRIVDGDWRRGLSLHQLATVDFAHLEENDTSLRWTALKLVPLAATPDNDSDSHPLKKRRRLVPPTLKSPHYPQIDPTTFLSRLKSQVAPLVKAHYSMQRLKGKDLTVVRLYIVPTMPFAPSHATVPTSPKHATGSARIMYIALPDSCPYVYISLSGAVTSKSLLDPKVSMTTKVDINTTKRIVLDAIPKSFSRPQERWSLESTKLTARSLTSMCLLRGNSRPGTGGGAYAAFSEEYARNASADDGDHHLWQGNEVDRTLKVQPPLRIQCPTPPPEEESWLQRNVQRRFGRAAGPSHAPLGRIQITIQNLVIDNKRNSGGSQSAAADKKPGRKRKRLSLEEIERGDFQKNRARQGRPNISDQATFTATNPSPSSIVMTFSGTDVIAGLRHLALVGHECLDMDHMPSWITGEKGMSGFTV